MSDSKAAAPRIPVCTIVTSGSGGIQIPVGCRLNGIDIPGIKDVMMSAEAGEPIYVTLRVLVSDIGFEPEPLPQAPGSDRPS